MAGCGTSQAARHAMRHPEAHVVGIDTSPSSIAHTRRLAERHGLDNLELRHLPIERVHELDQQFDHIVCTGVLHHLADPLEGLSRLGGMLAPRGALTLMVYGRYGRTGIYLLQEYCRRLGIGTTPEELTDLVATLRELPMRHPLSPLLRETRDFQDDGALADALLNPRDRAFSVPELLDLVDRAGLRFGRWVRQAPYLPYCGSISETPHAPRIAALSTHDQYAAVELFRGTIMRHSAVVFAAGDEVSGRVHFGDPLLGRWVPILVPTAVTVEHRLPGGVAAALINRAHTDTDLVLFADERQLEIFRSIDGNRTVDQLGADAVEFLERLWWHDLVVFDTTAAGTQESGAESSATSSGKLGAPEDLRRQ